jgi:hypothetical protein
MIRSVIGLVWVGGLVSIGLGACAADAGMDSEIAVDHTKHDRVAGAREAWGSADAPGIFGGTLEYKLASLPAAGEATNVPWAGNYWPVYEDSINHKWDGAGSTSAPAKYGQAFGVTGVEDAVSRYHGIDAQTSRKSCNADADCTSLADGSACAKRPGQATGRCIPTWWGICHAWTPAAILVAEPKYPVTFNGVTFKVQDIKALITLAHNSTKTKFVSLRCDGDFQSGGTHFDDYGRPDGENGACKDTNAATMHLLLANYLGVQHQAFAEDRTIDDEVWNQPIRGFKVLAQREVTAQEANALIGVTGAAQSTTNKSGTVAKNVWSHQDAVSVVPGGMLKVTMTGSGDADLYVRFGAQATASAYDCRPYQDSTNESCEIAVPANATQAFVSVKGYATSSAFQLKIVVAGAAPAAYALNPQAVKFFALRTEVAYIGESAANVDGNLAARIDQYTHKDTYTYVLELDAAGKIVGGEWTGDSKTDHPDFLWLPLSVSAQSVAGGKIAYAKVKQLYDLSLVPPGSTTPPTDGGSDKTVSDAFAIAKNAWKQLGPYEVAAGKNIVVTMTGDGDADLYVRKAAAPSLASYDCRPYQDGSGETCTLTGPGSFFVGVNGYAATSNVALTITYGAP